MASVADAATIRGAAPWWRDSFEPAHHLRHVGAEHAAIGMQLVDHDEREVGEELLPEAVVRQQARVQHVGRRDQHLRRLLAQRAPLWRRRVAVVDRHAQIGAAQRKGVGLEPAPLVLRECLQRKQVQGARARIRERGAQRGERVDERLAARGGGRERDVLSAPERGARALLVCVERRDPAPPEDGREVCVVQRQLRAARGLRGQALAVRERVAEVLLVLERAHEIRERAILRSARMRGQECHHGPDAHRGASGDDPRGEGRSGDRRIRGASEIIPGAARAPSCNTCG